MELVYGAGEREKVTALVNASNSTRFYCDVGFWKAKKKATRNLGPHTVTSRNET
jgi:hypothetical protein